VSTRRLLIDEVRTRQHLLAAFAFVMFQLSTVKLQRKLPAPGHENKILQTRRSSKDRETARMGESAYA